MLKIRLQRVGRKHEPSFRLVLTDSKNSTKSGKYLEVLGNYDSRHGEVSVFKTDRINYWMSIGAQPSDTVHNLLISKKIITGKKINVLPLKKPIVKEVSAEESKASAPAHEADTQPHESAEEETSAPAEEVSAPEKLSTEEAPVA